MICRSCGSSDLEEVIDLGEQYLSDFRDDDLKPSRYPLVLLFCTRCYLAQLSVTVPRSQIYHARYGFKSGVSDTVRRDLADVVWAVRDLKSPRSWLDIACNDGTLLSFVPKTIYRAGIDPIAKYCDESGKHADRIVCNYFDPSYFAPQKFDVITAISMFYDLDNPNEFLAGVKEILADDGILVVQQNYLASSLDLGAVDNICHEHITYFSLLSLENLLARHGLEVFDVGTSPTNGGSFRAMIAREGAFPISRSVVELRRKELEAGLFSMAPFKAFDTKVNGILECLGALIEELAAKGKRIYIYGASTRGATIWQGAGLTSKEISFAVDRNPEKVGRMFSPIGVPIIGEEEARANPPDYILIGPWFYADEIMAREKEMLSNGTRAILPLPVMGIVP